MPLAFLVVPAAAPVCHRVVIIAVAPVLQDKVIMEVPLLRTLEHFPLPAVEVLAGLEQMPDLLKVVMEEPEQMRTLLG